MITFAGLVVKPYKADSRPNKGQAVLEAVARTRQRRRHLPKDQLGEGILAEGDAFFEQQDGLHVGYYTNKSPGALGPSAKALLLMLNVRGNLPAEAGAVSPD